MRRRDFLGVLGGAAVAWPLVAQAQHQPMPVIGFLGAGTLSSHGQWASAFAQRLRELGWVEGLTIQIETRWAEGRRERAADIAAEFVRLKVDVIVASGTEFIIAAKRATSVIPLVFAAAGDPVRSQNLIHLEFGLSWRSWITWNDGWMAASLDFCFMAARLLSRRAPVRTNRSAPSAGCIAANWDAPPMLSAD